MELTYKVLGNFLSEFIHFIVFSSILLKLTVYKKKMADKFLTFLNEFFLQI